MTTKKMSINLAPIREYLATMKEDMTHEETANYLIEVGCGRALALRKYNQAKKSKSKSAPKKTAKKAAPKKTTKKKATKRPAKKAAAPKPKQLKRKSKAKAKPKKKVAKKTAE